MKQPNILVVQNVSRERPGFLFDVFARHGVDYTRVDLQKGHSYPELHDFDAMIVLGGPQSANDNTPHMREEIETVVRWLNTGKPYLGICLGMQVLAKAAGYTIVPSPIKEVGFRAPDGNMFEFQLTDAGKNDPVLRDMPERTEIFHWHGEMVDAHPQLPLLAKGSHCETQMIKVHERAYGVQGHFEVTKEMFHIWLEEGKEDPLLAQVCEETLLNDFDAYGEANKKAGETVFQNFVSLVENAR